MRVFSIESLLNIIDFIKDTKQDIQLHIKNLLISIQFSNIAYIYFKYSYVVPPIRIYLYKGQ